MGVRVCAHVYTFVHARVCVCVPGREDGRGEAWLPSAVWLIEEEGAVGTGEAHLSATSRRGSTVHCHRLKPSAAATCQTTLLCSLPVLFSTSTNETFPRKAPRMSQAIRSCRGEKSQRT